MSHGGSCDDRHGIQQIIGPGLNSQRLGDRNHEIEHGVKEDRNSQHETADSECGWRETLPDKAKRGAHDAFGGSTVQQATTDE
jgi:hypothetical protein